MADRVGQDSTTTGDAITRPAVGVPEGAPTARRSSVGDYVGRYATIGTLVFLIILFWATSPNNVFMTPNNISNILQGSAVLGVMATGLTIVLVTQEFDLSIGYVATFTGVMSAATSMFMAGLFGYTVGNEWCATEEVANCVPTGGGIVIIIAITVVSMLIGLVVGIANGLIVTKLHVSAFIATLAMAYLLLKAALEAYESGQQIAAPRFNLLPAVFSWLGTGTVGIGPYGVGLAMAGWALLMVIVWLTVLRGVGVRKGAKRPGAERVMAAVLLAAVGLIVVWFVTGGTFPIHYLVLTWILVIILAYLLMERTTAGRQLYAIGANPVAARLSGINVDRKRILAFALSGMLAGLSGWMLASKLGAGYAESASGLLLPAFAACFIGAATLRGGQFHIGGTVVGVFILGILENGLNLVSGFLDRKIMTPFGEWDLSPNVWKLLAQGVVLIAAVAIAGLFRKKSLR